MQNIPFKRSYSSQDSLKVVRMCMPKASIGVFPCYRYVLLIYTCSYYLNSQHELLAVDQIQYIKEAMASKLSCQKLLEHSSVRGIWYDVTCY